MSFDRLIKKPVALLLAVAVFGACSLAPADALAAKRGHQGANRVKFDKGGSSETVKDRDRRLARECRGRPNAGACMGFGQ